MALQRIERDGIQDDAINAAKIEDGTVAGQDIADGTITNTQINASAAIATSKISGLGTAATLAHGTSANQVVRLDSNAKIPAVNASLLTGLNAANITPGGTLPAISGANLTGVATDTSALENNIAILAFKTQAANNLAKFNLIDQVIDEYKDDTGLGTQTNCDRVGSTAADGYMSTIGAAAWQTLQNHDLSTIGANSGWASGYTLRQVIPAAAFSFTGTASKIRLWLQTSHAALNSSTFKLLGGSVGTQASSGNAWDFASTPTPITWSSSSTLSMSIQSTPFVSDEIDFVLDQTKGLVITCAFNGIYADVRVRNSAHANITAGSRNYYKGANVNEHALSLIHI